MWLTRLALRNPILILMVSLMAVLLGGLSVTRLGVDLFPNIDLPVIRIATFYAGAGPEDIEKSVTQTIERAVSSSPGVERVESTSKQGASIVNVHFPYGTNLDLAQLDLHQRIAQVQSTLPPGIQQPYVLKFDVSMIPTISIAVRCDGFDEKQLYELMDNVVGPQLERIAGVASAKVSGGKQRQVQVRVDRERLDARHVGILDVVTAVKGANLLLPSGSLNIGNQDFNVFTNTQVSKVRELGDVVVRPATAGSSSSSSSSSSSTTMVRVSDLAEVEDGAADQRNIVRVNGERGLVLRVFKQPGANTLAVVDAVRAVLPNLRGVPPNLKLEVAFDQSTYIRAAIKSLEHEALQGGLLAVIVILVFLVNLRATAVVAIAIPLSIVATFVLLYFVGATLNVFTLGGLALGVGRLVDDSIVELENIHRHLELTPADRNQAVLNAAEEVAMPILVSTLTTVIVFFPVLFLTGVARSLFVPLALTITFALVMSFFVSRTVTPLLCLSWIRIRHSDSGHQTPVAPRLVQMLTRSLDALDRRYEVALRWVLHRRRSVIGVILGVSLASLCLTRYIGTEFFPDADERQFKVAYKAPIGTRVERTEEIAQQIEQVIRQQLGDAKNPGTLRTISDCGLGTGRQALFSTNTGPHACSIGVNIGPTQVRPYSDVAALQRVRAALGSSFAGTTLTYAPGGTVRGMFNFGASAPIDVEILGHDMEQSARYAMRIAEKLRQVTDASGRPLLTDVEISREENSPELDIIIDRQKAGAAGVTQQQVAQTVLTSVVGNTQFSPIPFTDPTTGHEYFINVRLDDPFRSHMSDLREISVRTPKGETLSLASIGRVERSSGPVQISHKHLERAVDVTANVAPDRDLGAASNAVQRVLQDLPVPDGFSVRLGGVALIKKDAFQNLGLAAVIALLLVYMVLASQFKSFIDPLVIMFSVPLGVSGVLVVLWLTRTTLSVNSGMGIIMMVGIVVSNGVLLVDYANVLRLQEGVPLFDATVRAATTRLRPILMTSIATVAGLLPMAIGIGEGSATNMPMARAVVGGLTVSTFFTLFLIPSLYIVAERFKKTRAGVAQ